MKNDFKNFIQGNSLNEYFLQSNEWKTFQEETGKKTFHISTNGFWANIVEHKLPLVGNYFYLPRGPIIKEKIQKAEFQEAFQKIINLARENKAGWVRMDLSNKKDLEHTRAWMPKVQITKAPHNMQPKQILMLDITKPVEQLLAEMKAKTRYNIKLAKKKNVQIHSVTFDQDKNQLYFKEFLRLTQVMAKRQKIVVHLSTYYEKMWKTIPENIIKLYVAEYKNKIIATNLIIFYNKVAIYLHGASDNQCRNVMAPFLLQWQALLDAKEKGYKWYDMGGIKMTNKDQDYSWKGITRFKLGFSPKTKITEFQGSYDVVINPIKYWLYRMLRKIK